MSLILWDPKVKAKLFSTTTTPAEENSPQEETSLKTLKSLGCYIDPNGSLAAQGEILFEKSENNRMMTSPIVTKFDTYILYQVYNSPPHRFHQESPR